MTSYQGFFVMGKKGIMANGDDRIRDFCLLGSAEKSMKEELLEEEIRTMLFKAGIYPKLKGYDYLMAALRISISNPFVVKNVSNLLYPVVADYFSTTIGSVERGIRHALEVSCRRNKLDNINSVLGTEIFSSDDRPTNAEFISLIALKLSSLYKNRLKYEY